MKKADNCVFDNKQNSYGRIKVIVFTVIFLFVFFHQMSAQQSYVGNSFTSPMVAPGAPAGSYALSDIENVNLFNGNLNIGLPLLRVGGRGAAGYTMMLPIEFKWNISHLYYPTMGQWNHHYFPIDNWSGNNPDFIKYSPGAMRTQRAAEVYGNCQSVPSTAVFGKVLSRIIFIGADGTQLEFYDDRTKGKPAYFENCLHNPDAANRGTVWTAMGGSGITFVSDTVAVEVLAPSNDNIGYPSGVMMFPDGLRYRIDQGKVSYIIDRNGNKVSFTYGGAPGGNSNNLASVTDPLGRVITFSYGQGDTDPDIISFKGSDGAVRTIEVGRNLLGNLLRSDQTLKSTLELFPGLAPDVNSNDFRNPRRVAYVKLPNGRQYNFKYNSYSDIARIELPTGGAYEYEWNGGTPVPHIQRWVTERREYPDGASGASYQIKTKYEYFDNDPYINGKPAGKTKVTKLAATGSGDVSIGVSKHYFIGTVTFSSQSFSFDDSGFGKEFQTELYNSDGTSLIKKVFNEYEFRTVYTHTVSEGGINQTYTNRIDHRLIRTTTTLADVTPNPVAKKEFSYNPDAPFNQQTDVYEFDYGPNAPGNFMRRTHTNYLNDTNYISHTGAHLRNLPLQTWISLDTDGTTKTSLTAYEYDNYTSGNYAPLVNRLNVVGHNTTDFGTGKTIRGNVTKGTTYGNAQYQTDAISTYSQYDILGNIVKTIDAEDNASVIDYADRFGTPDGEAQSNAAPGQLNGQSTFAFPTSETNALGFTSYTQFDYFTDQPVNTEDINGLISKLVYNDPLDRLTKSVTAVGTPLESQTSVNYFDAPNDRRIEVKSDLNVLNDNLLKSESLYDGFGKTVETRRYESSVNYISTQTVPFTIIQDPETLAWRAASKISNPYRPNESEQPVWTTSLSDSIGRTIKVITPDNASVKTEYGGNAVTVTDQALKQRRSIFNALEQLIRVDESHETRDVNGNVINVTLGPVDTPAQPTYYKYNTLGKMIEVSQGIQKRHFLYDSLGRLLRVRQPEQEVNSALNKSSSETTNSQWTAAFFYDANGNILTSTDANNVTITSSYDALNRVVTRSYSGNAAPGITFTYDEASVSNSKGKLTKVNSSISETRYTSFDVMGRMLSSVQTTDAQNYSSSYKYNLAGILTEQIYPSGRIVKGFLGNEGNLSAVSSKISNGKFKTYASNISYTATGVIKHLQIGNGLWESGKINSRQQVTELNLGTSPSDGSKWQVKYDYGEFDINGNLDLTKNSGNIARQSINFAGLGQPFLQTYKYDSLNRIEEAKETNNGNQTWKQTWGYDQYGNRTSFSQNSHGQQLPINNLTLPPIDAGTNRYQSGQGFEYDKNGNLTNEASGMKLTFDGNNKQTEVRTSSDILIGRYYYDGNGNRVKKIEYDQNGAEKETLIFVYNGMNKLVAEYSTFPPVSNPTTNYTITDPLGSPRVIVNKLGEIVSRRDFMPFGEQIAPDATYRTANLKYLNGDNIRQKFTGYESDKETQLYFAKARYYNDRHGRFTAIDPLLASGKSDNPQTFNRYVYTMNRPLILTDSTGLQSGTNPNQDKQAQSPIKVTYTIPPTRVFVNERVVSNNNVKYFTGVGAIITIRITDANGKPIAGAKVSEKVSRSGGQGNLNTARGTRTTDQNGEVSDLAATGKMKDKPDKGDPDKKAKEIAKESNKEAAASMITQTLTITTPDGGVYEATSVRVRGNIGENDKPSPDLNENGLNTVITQTPPEIKVIKTPEPAKTPVPPERMNE